MYKAYVVDITIAVKGVRDFDIQQFVQDCESESDAARTALAEHINAAPDWKSDYEVDDMQGDVTLRATNVEQVHNSDKSVVSTYFS